MKSQKDIETIIREGEKKLVLQPSPQAWQKLERRLEARRPKKNATIVGMRRWVALAATLLVLVVSLFFWSTNQYEYLPTFVEELNGNDGCNPFCMTIEARKDLPAFYTVPPKGG